jgi:hypothetical protein
MDFSWSEKQVTLRDSVCDFPFGELNRSVEAERGTREFSDPCFWSSAVSKTRDMLKVIHSAYV